MGQERKARSKTQFNDDRKEGFLQSVRTEFQHIKDVEVLVDGFVQENQDKKCCGWLCYTSSLYYVLDGQRHYVSGSKGESERGTLLSCELTCRTGEGTEENIQSLHVRREGQYWSAYKYAFTQKQENTMPIQYFEEQYFSALTYENQNIKNPKKWMYRLCWGKEVQDDIEIWEPKVGVLVGLA